MKASQPSNIHLLFQGAIDPPPDGLGHMQFALRVSTMVLVNSLKKAPSCSVFIYPWLGIIFIAVRAGANDRGGTVSGSPIVPEVP